MPPDFGTCQSVAPVRLCVVAYATSCGELVAHRLSQCRGSWGHMVAYASARAAVHEMPVSLA
eukprot:13052871-Alexandrium_andersonii.AAC.1